MLLIILEHGLFLLLQIGCQRSILHDGHHFLVDNLHKTFLLVRVGVKLHNQPRTRHRQTSETATAAHAITTAFTLADRLQIAGRENTANHLHIQCVRQGKRNIV